MKEVLDNSDEREGKYFGLKWNRPDELFYMNFKLNLGGTIRGSLSAYGAVAYVHSVERGGHLLTSTAKVIGRGKYTPPQSEMAAALLTVRLANKIKKELLDINIDFIQFIGDSQITLNMIAWGRPSRMNVFFGSRVMAILANTAVTQWYWCGGPCNPADLTTRAGCTADD